MTDTYYIDGYNVLHEARHLKELADKDFESAREGLIDKIALYTSQKKFKTIIVFDGRQGQVTAREEHHRGTDLLQVYYAPAHLTADTVIEREIYQAEKRMQCVVVSNDQGMRDLCRGFGALVMNSRSYLQSVYEIQAEMKQQMQYRKMESPARLEDGLSEDMREKLQQLKNKLK